MCRSLCIFLSVTYMVLVGGLGSIALAAPLSNGSFADGFNGWAGQLSGYTVETADLSNDPHFSIGGNGATLSYADLSDPFWNFTLYQSFDVEPVVGPGYGLNLSFYMQLTLGENGSPDGHVVSATLNSLSLIDTTDAATLTRLLNGDWFSVDVTSLAGSPAVLAFTLGDLDYSVTDYLTVGNISFSPAVQASPVPEPGTLLLVGAGLIGVVAFSRNRKRVSL